MPNVLNARSRGFDAGPRQVGRAVDEAKRLLEEFRSSLRTSGVEAASIKGVGAVGNFALHGETTDGAGNPGLTFSASTGEKYDLTVQGKSVIIYSPRVESTSAPRMYSASAPPASATTSTSVATYSSSLSGGAKGSMLRQVVTPTSMDIMLQDGTALSSLPSAFLSLNAATRSSLYAREGLDVTTRGTMQMAATSLMFTVSSVGGTGDGRGFTIAGTPTAPTYSFSSVGVSTFSSNVYLDADTGQIYRSTSARRYKKDIRDIDASRASDALALHPRSWLDRATEGGPRILGFVAEEVIEAGFPELVNYDESGQVQGLMYDRICAVQQLVIVDMDQRIKELTSRLEAVEASLSAS